jgi:hypothetical protein
MFFDGSDVGAAGKDLNGFVFLSDGSILMTFDDNLNLPGLFNVDDSDIVQFFPTSLGPNTAGTFSLYFDGSDVGLTTRGEEVDALGLAPDGRLVLSTRRAFNVSGVSGQDEDLLVFNATSLGSTTGGTFDLYFDGSDVGLGYKDIEGTWIDPATGEIYLSINRPFSLPGVNGDGSDIFVCDPSSLGASTSCTFSPFWDGSANGFGSEVVDALAIDP